MGPSVLRLESSPEVIEISSDEEESLVGKKRQRDHAPSFIPEHYVKFPVQFDVKPRHLLVLKNDEK